MTWKPGLRCATTTSSELVMGWLDPAANNGPPEVTAQGAPGHAVVVVVGEQLVKSKRQTLPSRSPAYT
jgi:hypothetical protein